MITFDQAGKTDLISKLEAHAKADAFTQQYYYFKNGKGSAVGCSLVNYGVDPDDHSQYEKLFGIPREIAALEDVIFSGFSAEKSKKWPLRFTHAVPVEADLSGVWPKFAREILINQERGVIRFAETDDQKEVIQRCADLYVGEPCTAVEAARAAHAAETMSVKMAEAADAMMTAYSAALIGTTDASGAALYASLAAAWAADAKVGPAQLALVVTPAERSVAYSAAQAEHYEWMADTLIRLLEEAGTESEKEQG